MRVYAKAEWFNASGSVKDRAALWMVREGERRGLLTPAKTILDATSGNAGIAYAMIGASLGYRVLLTLPKNAGLDRKRILRAYGAEVVLTDPLEGADGAISKAKEIYESNPSRYYYPDQYSNEANWRAHHDTTAPEILAQTEGRVTHFVAGVGTGGTVMGVGRALKEHNPNIKIIAVQPDSPLHGIEGLKHLKSSHTPPIFDPAFPDEVVEVNTEEAQHAARRLALEEGLFVGVSSGATTVAAQRLAERVREGVVVAIFGDGGDRYLSDDFWEVEP